ncbi:hypothetical protein CLIB1423_02S02564 [[Candida] railenensis]|uniref:RNA polymerase II-associated protein 3 n=1 Tax=[Candida] railenensis TaxID=45579 RepID=A0A9P0QLM4_9ASCO|nr:hypothetical protein CLIB1423_02S02564 [[Candida] railenensis]
MSESASDLKKLGNEAFAKQEYKKAAKIYRDALKLDFNSVLLSNRAMCFIKLEDWERAIRDCKEGLSNSPPPERNLEIKLWYRLGVAYKGMGQLQHSKSALEHSLLLDPENTPAKSALEEVSVLLSIRSPVTVPVESVEELPEQYRKLISKKPSKTQNLADKPSEQAEREINELFPSRPSSKPVKHKEATEFHKHSSMHFLPLVNDQLTEPQRLKVYKAIIDIPPTDYEEAFEIGGVDTDFLPTFFKAIRVIITDKTIVFSEYEQKIYNLIKTFYEIPRFQIALSFCDKNDIDVFLQKLIHFNPESYGKFKEFI